MPADTGAASPYLPGEIGTAEWSSALGAERSRVLSALDALVAADIPRRIWDKDNTVWKPDGSHAQEIRERLGWLTVASDLRPHAHDLRAFAERVRDQGCTDTVLLGMGGSSLCVEALRQACGRAPGYPTMHVLDTTHPAAIEALSARLDPATTTFIVASISGRTIETLAQYRYFFNKVHDVKGNTAGESFIAITGQGTSLEAIADDRHFLRVFDNPPDIHGPYSALSLVGLVPASLMGLDLARLLDSAESMMRACDDEVPAERNPAVQLGAAMGALALAGRNKLTLDLPPELTGFGAWVEQLIAESTGKEGKGIVPVVGEPLGAPDQYGHDRLFVHVFLDSAPRDSSGLRAVEAAGHPIVRIRLHDAYDLGAEFYRWKFATALASGMLGVDAFDQPDLQQSKDALKRLLDRFGHDGALPTLDPLLDADGVDVYSSTALSPHDRSLAGALQAFLQEVRQGDYMAIMAYLPPDVYDAPLQAIRSTLRDRLRVATTFGYCPRFLHSTGQLQKGGPTEVVALQIVAQVDPDLPIPGMPYAFATLLEAESLANFKSLQASGRRALRLDLGTDISSGLQAILRVLSTIP